MHAMVKLCLAGGVALLAGACAAPRETPSAAAPAREALAAAERAFARDSVERGMRAAFLDHFAEDGINFSPGPGNTRERFRARPEAVEPFILDWHPAIAAVAHAGDLGFTTGPYTITGRPPAVRETAHGVFFSVWRRQDDGRWRVIVDGGTAMNAPAPDATFGEDPIPLPPVAAAANTLEQKTLAALEAQVESGDASAAAGGYAALLADDAILIVGPTPPSLGRDAIIANLAERRLRFRCETLAAGVSRSDDFAYTYGRLHRLDAATDRPRGHVAHEAADNGDGYYVHVWMRDRGGRWRITAELLLLLDGAG
ncbi:MAG: DUF4440 domain-containing protein [Casimicrobiaceae bacterium]